MNTIINLIFVSAASATWCRRWGCVSNESTIESIVVPVGPLRKLQMPQKKLVEWTRRDHSAGELAREAEERAATPQTLSGSSSPETLCEENMSIEEFVARTEEDDIAYQYTAPRLHSTDEANGRLGSRWLGPAVLYESSQKTCTNLHLSQLIAHTQYSSVFYIQRGHTNSGLVLKYQSNCDEIPGIHPLLKEKYFLDRLRSLEIAPKAFWLSAPTHHPQQKSTKIDFTISENRMLKCHQKGATVRFLVMEETGKDMYSLIGTSEGYMGALQFGYSLISMLKTLYENNIVHGDIHPGNVVRWKNGQLRIIDFERAAEGNIPIPHIHPSGRFYHPYLSPWEMQGFESSFRDDVYRAVEIIYSLVYGTHYFSVLTSLEKTNPAKIPDFKNNPKIVESGLDPQLTRKIDEIRNIAKSGNEIPDYTNILRILDSR